MADTQRSVAEILALLATVPNGISAQDLRDAFVTWRMAHGQIYVKNADAAAVVIPDTTNYVECSTPVWTPSTGLHMFDESAGNGRLTYTGVADVTIHAACTVSFLAASNNQVIHLRLAKNGTTDEASEIIQKCGTGGDVGSSAIHLVTTLSNGDWLSLFVRNETSASNVTISAANLQCVTMPS